MTLGRCTKTVLLALAVLCVLTTQASLATGQETQFGRIIQVPLSRSNPSLGKRSLYFEFGAPYDKSKPVILVIADGQQFYVRKDSVKALQEKLFGDAFNVVGIVTRGSTPEFIQAALDNKGQPDWLKAWQIFNSEQWIDDIDAVRKAIVGEHGRVFLYGRSGGAYLVHEYLTRHGDHVLRAFTQSAVNPFIVHDLGIGLDRFWSELSSEDSKLQPLLLGALEQHPDERIKILMTLQRQHFYVSADKIAAARADLIRVLAKGAMSDYERARKDYEVDDVIKMSESNDIVPQNVRVLELIYPSGAFQSLGDGAIYPLIETQHHFLEPLISLLNTGRIPAPSFDDSAAHKSQTEVFILAGRWDEAVDYRTSIAFAYGYPKHELFIADDNHVFSKLSEGGADTQLLRSFFHGGLGSSEFQNAIKNATQFRWVER
jgi:pimeloyl-ACP methyl ester carboxylesterase